MSDKVSIRPFELNDVEKLYQWKNDKEIFKYLGGGYRPQSRYDLEKHMEALILHTMENQRFMIEVEQENDLVSVGVIGLYNMNFVHRTCEIGIYIGEKIFQGKGIASRALKDIENYAKNYLNLRKINLDVVKANEVAVQFWEKNGYKLVGTKMKHRLIDNNYFDLEIREKFL
ncbi:GNAT family protein [Candidatus Enterococcus clewellii]|uniref:N-acetyltransferase domain-containing protein n=1 Tax=Candidatus Enterococcus clewellii TaxID=1834193 RepID=A0AAQ3Y0E1_9ENTE